MCMTIALVLSHLVIRTQYFWKIKEKKIEKIINNDLAIVASQIPKKAVYDKYCGRGHVSSTKSSPRYIFH